MSNDSNDDSELHEFDLSAWEAPEAPAGLADAVIARLGAIDTTTTATAATATELDRRRPRLRVLVGIVSMVGVAAGMWLLIRSARKGADAPVTGVMVADRARHLELDKVSADLDLGADVRWHTTAVGMDIEQHAGAVTWRVASGSQVVIAAGTGTGATASIEATGASLRVELQPMNMSDVRVIGASALTAAAVAMITVVVYEGHVKATSAGQTVVVQPGSSVEIRPGQPPAEPLHVGLAPPVVPTPTVTADLAINAGESVTIHDPDGSATVQIQGPCSKDTAISVEPTTAVQPGGVIAIPIGHYRYEVRCDGSAMPIAAGTIDLVRDRLRAAPDAPSITKIDADGRTYNLSFQHNRIPTIQVQVHEAASQYVLILQHAGASELRLSSQTSLFTIDRAQLGAGSYTIDIELDGKRQAKTTKLVLRPDLAEPIAQILEPVHGARWSSPVHLNGLLTVPDVTVTAAGRGISVDGQQRFSGDLTLGAATTLVIRVAHPKLGVHYFIRRAGTNDVTADKTTCDEVSCVLTNYEGACCAKFHTAGPACNAEALRYEGTQEEATGDHAKAIGHFEEADACKPDLHTKQLAFMAACNAGNLAKARQHYLELTKEMRDKVKVMCIRNGITEAKLDQAIPAQPAK